MSRYHTLVGVAFIASSLGLAGVGLAQTGTDISLSLPTLELTAWQPEPAATPENAENVDAATDAPPEFDGEKARPRFGSAGSSWLTLGLGYMHDLSDDQAGEVHAGYSRFLTDEIEFNVELTAWYFDQTGDNTGGLNPGFNFRWHFLHDDAFDWTVYGEVGIGLLFAFDNVPDGGTGFNFTPRAGAGFTKQLTESGVRLQIGARWQHISNGRIEGDGRNPGRESLMGYVGVMFPF